MSPYENPFDFPYLTEASNQRPEDLLSRYSFEPFFHLQDRLARRTNVFLLGRKGVGKTMLLKLFDHRLMALVYSSSDPEYVRVRGRLPRAVLGVYLNLSAPASRLSLFSGRGLEKAWWTEAYADYLNCLLLAEALASFNALIGVEQWRTENGLALASMDEAPLILRKLHHELERDAPYLGVDPTFADTISALESRGLAWVRYINQASPSPPPFPRPLGAPLFAFQRALTAALPGPAWRLFLLVDQYDNLYSQRHVVDFRPMFNQAMYLATRGGTGVEFKVGTRPYAHRNFLLPDGGTRLERDREMIEVSMDAVADKFYRQFAIDLFTKRLGRATAAQTETGSRSLAEKRLPGLEPRLEAKWYLREAGTDRLKHFARFKEALSRLDCTAAEIDDAFTSEAVQSAEPLSATLACMALVRWVRDGRTRKSLLPRSESDVRERIAAGAHVTPRSYLEGMISRIERRYDLGTTLARKSGLAGVDDFVRDAEPAALFLIASSYKNQRKYFAGLDTVVLLSSNVALVFIEILRAAYERLLYDGGNPGRDVVSVRNQSEAIYRVSEAWFSSIRRETEFGLTMQKCLRGLGVSFRRLQMDVTAPVPDPNGVSVGEFDLPDTEDGPTTKGPREDAGRLLVELLSWGLLEEQTHEDKGRAKPKRRKLYLNRVLCPYFGVSPRRHKDPVYVRDVSGFVERLLNEKTPEEFEDVLLRARRGRPHQHLVQGELL